MRWNVTKYLISWDTVVTFHPKLSILHTGISVFMSKAYDVYPILFITTGNSSCIASNHHYILTNNEKCNLVQPGVSLCYKFIPNLSIYQKNHDFSFIWVIIGPNMDPKSFFSTIHQKYDLTKKAYFVNLNPLYNLPEVFLLPNLQSRSRKNLNFA